MPIPPPRNKHILNGTWQLQPSNDDAIPSEWNYAVPVPALVNSADPLYVWKEFKYHWYRKTFDLAYQSELAFVVVEQSMFGTDVWVNEKHLGGDIACYTSQEYDARFVLRGMNELVVRVGRREDLPSHSAVGNDQERTEWIPGIWGDVYVLQCPNPRVKLVQMVPHIESATAEARITVENLSGSAANISLTTVVREKRSGQYVSDTHEHSLNIAPHRSEVVVVRHAVDRMQIWSPENPFLYVFESKIQNGESAGDRCETIFGMREFRIVDGDFYFNGKKIFLKGGNIAFHRFLSDADRRTLPWNPEWIKKALIAIPRAHNFNFFRNHIGQMYNRWYDIADEHGMLLQNEWMFWTTTGTKEQINREFTRWLQDNWNHPSIIIWDALNECTDDVVQKEIVPAMKDLDPTRPWESVDFIEEHPYIYSLGPVLNDRKFGFTRSLQEIERSPAPVVLNEFCWWWLDNEYNPSLLTRDVVERWLGPEWKKDELIAHQSFLVTELVELFRRIRVDAIQPFVYLSNNSGPTGHWFVGNIAELKPKPILAALKNAFAPFGVSIELWDRHFTPNELRMLRIFVFNDEQHENTGTLRCGIVNGDGKWVYEQHETVVVGPLECIIHAVTMVFPGLAGKYTVRAELLPRNGTLSSYSEKAALVISVPEPAASLQRKKFTVLEPGNEITMFLSQKSLCVADFSKNNLEHSDCVVASQDAVRSVGYQSRLPEVTRFLQSGKTLILVEPEFGIKGRESVPVAEGIPLTLEQRADTDKGGYDSYVFATDHSHPLWQGISRDHLKMFNGGYGGEVVSEHNISCQQEMTVYARCGLSLAVPAAFEIACGRGRIIVSRIQLRGRLLDLKDQAGDTYARKPDPVLQSYLLNLLAYSIATPNG